METINIFGENRFEPHTKTRKACRGIVISYGMILVTYEVNTDQWFIPGGGLNPAKVWKSAACGSWQRKQVAS